jgi:hypothetical protein
MKMRFFRDIRSALLSEIFHTLVLVVLISLLWNSYNRAQSNDSSLREIYNSYNKAILEGSFDKIISFLTSDVQKDINTQVKTKKEKKQFLYSAKIQVPESYEILHSGSDKDSMSVTLHTIMQFAPLKEIQRERSRIECDIIFKNENSNWKLGSLLFLSDPDKIVHPSDLTYNPEDADLDKEGDIGGRIVKTEFNPGYTLVIIRVLDEENAVFLKSKSELLKDGVSLKELEPWNIYEFTGHPHKSDKLKFFATGGKPVSN